ncbi:cysteine-rich receptor kinase 10 [Olea europaea subsp. europaea]|uniref:Cysteine-rich receptor kinase 10 n=1 Tax=Olea europaea subsp. europaea TaxID=158383 RepID=A0A8S0RY90_OLEEU|nr:cysteine-rich receptor kinase 10 [Olea europaea subsp. europaea]
MSALSISAYFLLFCFLSSFGARRVSSLNFLRHFCPNTTTYSPNSIYQSNLNQLLLTLSSNATRENGYYNYTVGHSPPDTIYGFFLCRGDVNTDVCEICVKNATTIISQRCPNQKEATIWYDKCMLRYSNRSIFSRVNFSPGRSMFNTQNFNGNSYNFIAVLVPTMNETVHQAAHKFSGKKFATKDANVTASGKTGKLFTLAQCTPDLSSEDCLFCLQDSTSRLPACCENKKGVTFISLSCNIRYETYPFYNATTVPAAAPAPAPELAPAPNPKNKQGNGGISRQVIIAIVVPIAVVSLVVLLVGLRFLTGRTMKQKQYGTTKERNEDDISTVESLQYELNTIEIATTSFSADNKIGEGGFGDVYKGTFPDGQEIAVKRLSKSSAQGAKEFKNEIVLVAKLQHRNLVRLLGFCLEGEEKILIYEFVPNKSLDYFLFDPEKQRLLDWSRRHKIIRGITRGLLYLHEESRLKIVHRDLKASNKLLDKDMNPKISDFGMARIFDVDQSVENTIKIAGTYGYMAPEYAIHGQFSVKSDVFSFGVLILEIISGKKSNGFYKSHGTRDLISYAWKLWRNGAPLELMDPTLQESFVSDEVIRCIRIGLLCVEEDVNKRPTMSSILPMLESYSDTLPIPRRPAFFIPSGSDSMTKERNPNQPQSINEASISELCPR